MQLMMAGLDYRNAPLALREKLAFSKGQIDTLSRIICQSKGVEGCVLLSTCNRTELYLSLVDGSVIHPDALLCECVGVSLNQFDGLFIVKCGDDVVNHLFAVACGMESQIWGEDQILTQVKMASALAREVGSIDAILETLFRTAISAGKRMKREVRLSAVPSGIAEQSVQGLVTKLGSLKDKTAIVIGNGEIGRRVATLLIEQGCIVTMTLRNYHYGAVSVPNGCDTILYEDRYYAMQGKHFVISATTSPHYTIIFEEFQKGNHMPKLLIDLAVPRDIDETIVSIEGIALLDIDHLGNGIKKIVPPRGHEILQEFKNRFYRWLQFRCRIPVMDRGNNQNFHFPIFVDLNHQSVIVIGGGTIATRRVNVLIQFGADVTVISPTWQERDGVRWIPRHYREGDLKGATLVIAATNDRNTNFAVGEEARYNNIPVSVADAQEECTFYFPAICMGEDVVAAVVSHGKNHRKTAQTAIEIRKIVQLYEK